MDAAMTVRHSNNLIGLGGCCTLPSVAVIANPSGLILYGNPIIMAKYKSQTVPMKCLCCGKVFQARSRSVKVGRGKFCSMSCNGKVAGRISNARRTRGATHQQQVRVGGLVNRRVRQGLLDKPNICENCGKAKPLDGHHDDYSKPYEVKWLCRSCHMKHHFKTNWR